MNGVDLVRHEIALGASRAASAVRHASTNANAHMSPGVVAAFVLLAGIGIGIATVSLVIRRDDALDEMLRPYRLLPASPGARERLGGLRPAVHSLGERLLRLIDFRGLRPALEQRLYRSGLEITSGEFLVVAVVLVVGATTIGGVVGHVAGAVIGLVVGGLSPFAFLEVRIDKRQRTFGQQLPAMLKLLASSLRAGFSFLQCLAAVTEQSSEPSRSELATALGQIRLGAAVEDALEEVAERFGSQDFRWTVMAIRIQREVGGNLADILDTVAETMLDRERIRREVRTLTAEGRASAFILGALPVALGLFIFMANRAYLDVMTSSTPGQIALMVGVLMELVGAWWMHKTIQVEV